MATPATTNADVGSTAAIRGLPGRGVIWVVTGLALAGVAYLASRWAGSLGVQAAMLAVGVCVAAASLGRVASWALKSASPAQASASVLAAMLFRMAGPLAACVAVALIRHDLVAAGFGYWVVLAYLIVLGGETLGRVGEMQQQR